ncbi:ABC transporter permease [Microbacterium sp.]|uniref:ABC transporter permease n=1 Tax=Microbacterium sp. TaxID=51671 RepID=UPI002BE7F077|nr:ABC transporter permease [Microbacterium sp.]HWK76276.1 ABC transporter permease [Microbacterium sp.]
MTSTKPAAPTVPATVTSSTTTMRRAEQRQRQGGDFVRRLWSLPGVLILIATWEFLPRLSGAKNFPPLSAVVGELISMAGTSLFWEYLFSTLRTWAVGLVIACLAGIVLGVLIGLIPGALRYLNSMIEFLRPIPSVALIPAVILIFGTKFESGVVLIVYAGVWPMLLQTIFGLRDLDTVARDTARTYRFTPIGYARRVLAPAMLPPLFTGFRLSASIALVLAVTGEMVIGTKGIGQGITIAQTSGATTSVYALVLVAGLLGVLINLLARVLERRLLWWHPMIRNATKGH